jgi:hypothetical protein
MKDDLERLAAQLAAAYYGHRDVLGAWASLHPDAKPGWLRVATFVRTRGAG